MAQIIKHRRGSLEALSNVTSSLQKGELVIASGSSNLSVTNGASIVFAVPENGQVQAVNRILVGDNAPNTFAAGTYNGMLKGVPYYASGSSTLYLLGEGANDIPDLTGNISNFSSSVSASIAEVVANVGSGVGVSITNLNTFSGSTLVSLDALNSFSSSQLEQNIALATVSGSLIESASAAKTTNDAQDVSISNLNSFTSSFSQSVATSFSASTADTAANLSSYSSSAASAQSSYSSSVATSFSASAAAAATSQSQLSASIATTISSEISSLSSSVSTDIVALEGRVDELEAFSSSIDSAISVDGADVTIKGNFLVQGTQTIVDSTTVQIGDNIIELNGSQAANGGLYIVDATAPNLATGSLLWDSTNDYWVAGTKDNESKVLVAGGDSVVSGSSQITISDTTGFDTYSGSVSSSLAEIVANVGSGVGVSITNLNSFTSSIDTTIKDKLDVEGVISGSSQVLLTSADNTGFNTSYVAEDSSNLYFTDERVKTKLDAEGVISGSSQVTISSTTGFDTFSGSVATSFSASAASVSALSASVASVTGDFSSSVATSFSASAASQTALSSSFAASQAVQDGRLTELETKSGSVDVSISNLHSFTSSINTTIQTKIDSVGLFSGSVQTDITQTTGYSTFSGSIATSISASAANVTALSASIDGRLDTLEGTGTIQGVGTENNVTFAKVTTTGDVVVGGDLVVQGNTVTLNTATLIVEDKLITLASGSTSSATADGAGIEIAGADVNFVYQHSTTAFTSSVALIAPAVTASINLGSTAGSSKRVAFRNTNGNLDLVPTASVAGDLLQWDGSDFVMSNVIDGGSF
jgi:hypothetical protein